MAAALASSNATDRIQQQIAAYAHGLHFDSLPAAVTDAAKLHMVDSIGALIAGFDGEPCRIARKLAADLPFPDGTTVVGTRMKTTLDLAAFVNGTTSRQAEIAGRYDMPGSFGAHTSDAVLPLLSVAEHVHASGRELITAIVLAYELCSRISHFFRNHGFDNTNLSCLAIAAGAARLMGLQREGIAQCLSMAVVPGAILKQAKSGRLTMFKAVVSGAAARHAVFAAMLARAGMAGPNLPFEGKAGWCDHVAGARFSLDVLGGGGTPYTILDTRIKIRPAAGPAIASILAAEKLAPIGIRDVREVLVEVNGMCMQRTVPGGEPPWPLESREDADHSTPYLVAASLIHGTLNLSSYEDEVLCNPDVLALMQKIRMVENPEFTAAYERVPQQNHARITVTLTDARKVVGVAGGDAEDLASPKNAAQVEAKFRSLCESRLGTPGTNAILARLWALETLTDIGDIPPLLVIE